MAFPAGRLGRRQNFVSALAAGEGTAPPPIATTPDLALSWRAGAALLALEVVVHLIAAVLLATVLSDASRADSRLLLAAIALHLVQIVVVVWLARSSGNTVRALGLGPPDSWRRALQFGGLLIAAGLMSVAVASGVLGLQTQAGTELAIDSPLGAIPLVLLLIDVIVLTALAEELVYRGALYALLRPRLGPLLSLVVTAVAFAAAHRSLAAFVPLALFGAVLALTYERYGSLLPCIILHGIRNAIAVVLVLAAT